MTPRRLQLLFDSVMNNYHDRKRKDQLISKHFAYIAVIDRSELHMPQMSSLSGFCLLPNVAGAIVYSDRKPTKWMKANAKTLWMNPEYVNPIPKTSWKAKKWLTKFPSERIINTNGQQEKDPECLR